jgi:hypothetical protein
MTGCSRAASEGGSGRFRLDGERILLLWRDDDRVCDGTGEVVLVVDVCEICEAWEGTVLCLESADMGGCVASSGDCALEACEVVESVLRWAG